MMLAIYIVVILECYYAFKERKIRPVETLSSKCFLWRALLTMSEREMRQRGSPVRLPGSLLWTLWRMASIVFTWSFCIFSDDCTEPSEEGSPLRECGECLQLRCDLIQYCFPKNISLIPQRGGFYQPRWSRDSLILSDSRILWKEKPTSFIIICRFRENWDK